MTRRRVFALSLLVFACSACASSSAEPAAPSPLERQILALADRMEELHPNLFAVVPRERFRADAEELARRSEGLSRAELVVELMRLTALGERNGHTGIFVFHPHARPLHVYPLRLYLFADGLHVVHAWDGALVGARLEAVEGLPVARIVEAVTPLIPHDNDSGRTLLLPEYVVTEELLAGLGLTDGGAATFSFAGGRTATLEPVATSEYPQGSVVQPLLRPSGAQPLWLRHPERDQWLTTLDRGRVVYFAYRETHAPRGDLADRLLRRARKKSVRRVVIDVRLNGGGDNTSYWSLIQVLKRPVVGRKTVVLLGRKTFSAAGNFVAEVDHQTQARFFGEPSGGSPNQWGDSAPVDVPAAGLTVHVAVEDVVVVPDDTRLAVAPDVAIDVRAADFFAGRDPVLERAIAR